jgi:hypothetical protein
MERIWDGQVVEQTDTKLDTAQTGEFSFRYTQEGSYRIWVEAVDAAGNQGVSPEGLPIAQQQITFVIDYDMPELQISGIGAGEMTTQPVTLTFSATDRNHDFSAYTIHVSRSTVSGQEEAFDLIGTPLSDYDLQNGWSQQDYAPESQCSYTTSRVLQFQKEGRYRITWSSTDLAGNTNKECSITFSIDRTAPVVSGIAYSDVNGWLLERYNTIFSNQVIRMEFDVTDQVVGVNQVYVTVGTAQQREENTPIYVAQPAFSGHYYVYLPSDVGVAEFSDEVTIWVNDLLGNETSYASSKVIYNTDYARIVMDCDQDYSVWTKEDITFHTSVTDEKSGIREITYTINGKIVDHIVFDQLTTEYKRDITATENADKVTGYTVSVQVINNAGTSSEEQRQVYIDKEKPKLSLSGIPRGAYFRTSQSFLTKVEDVSYTSTKVEYFVTRTLDGKTTTMPLAAFSPEKYEDSSSRKLIREGRYRIYAVATDGAGNQTVSNTLSFVIDKTAPVLAISGVTEGSVHGEAVTLEFSCKESFYKTNQVSIQVERTLDGTTERSTLAGFPRNGKTVSKSYTFQEDGTYQITMTATDKAGNVAGQKTIHFSVDCTTPALSITGSSNYQQWDKAATIQFVVEESYYSGNQVTITGTRQDINGEVTELTLPDFSSTGKRSSLTQTFGQDGIYEVVLTAEDEAGNRDKKTLHFTVDQTRPEIRQVAECDGKYYQEFRLADSLEEIFRDLTVVSCRMTLNGVEYNGTDTVQEDGKYHLSVEVKDELGHTNSQDVEFIIDHTAPKVIFTGVKDGESVRDSGIVTLSTTNPEDEITAVRMNGVAYDADTRVLSYEAYGSYRIEVDCVDKAGNQVTRSLYFVYRNPVTLALLLGGMGLLVLVTCVWLWVRTRRKEREERQ